MADLGGKIAVITGAGDGIGRGCALVFAKHGADVIITDLNLDSAMETAREVEALGRRAGPAAQRGRHQFAPEGAGSGAGGLWVDRHPGQ